MGNFVAAAILLALVGLAIYKIVKDKKAGKCPGCSCGCSGCDKNCTPK